VENTLFTDVYNDKEFNRNANAMLLKMYRNSQTFFQDFSIDFDDFIQEMWCELFEEKRFNPDRAWCMEAIRCNAENYIKVLRNRNRLVKFEEYDDDAGLND
jgi:hypothetical protein